MSSEKETKEEEEEEEEQGDDGDFQFLNSCLSPDPLVEDPEDGGATTITISSSDEITTATTKHVSKQNEETMTYNPRKPRWWSKLCSKASRAQKRSITEVMKTHELIRVKYWDFIDWNAVFASNNKSIFDDSDDNDENGNNNNNNNNNNYHHPNNSINKFPIWFEIGFGRGENLLALAHRKRNESTRFVGAEVSGPGVGNVCQRIERGIASNSFWTGYMTYSPDKDPKERISKTIATPDDDNDDDDTKENNEASIASDSYTPACDGDIITPYDNLRIYRGDGIKLLLRIPSSSVAAVLVTFPDPFPENAQAQYRVLQVETIREMHRILEKPSGTLFLATDHEEFFKWGHEVMEKVNGEGQQYFEEIDPSPDRMDWLPAISTYEQKGWNEGRQTMLRFWRALSIPEKGGA